MLVERHILAFELYGRGKSGLPAHFIGTRINSQESPVPSAHSWESPGRPGDPLPGLFIGAASCDGFWMNSSPVTGTNVCGRRHFTKRFAESIPNLSQFSHINNNMNLPSKVRQSYDCLIRRRSKTCLAVAAKNKWQGKQLGFKFFECLGTHLSYALQLRSLHSADDDDCGSSSRTGDNETGAFFQGEGLSHLWACKLMGCIGWVSLPIHGLSTQPKKWTQSRQQRQRLNLDGKCRSPNLALLFTLSVAEFQASVSIPPNSHAPRFCFSLPSFYWWRQNFRLGCSRPPTCHGIALTHVSGPKKHM